MFPWAALEAAVPLPAAGPEAPGGGADLGAGGGTEGRGERERALQSVKMAASCGPRMGSTWFFGS